MVEGPPLHDPVAIAVLLSDDAWPSLAFDIGQGERWDVQVVTSGEHSDDDKKRGQVGRTIITPARDGGVRIPRGMNVSEFWDILTKVLGRAEMMLPA